MSRPLKIQPEPAEAAVLCRGVRKTYGAGETAVQALRGVDLDVHTGELMMLVGPSGCGKTTLISIVAGILDSDAGDCRVFGEDYRGMSARAKTAYRGRNIGFVFQAYNLIPTLTAAENVAAPLLIQGEPRKRALDRARDMLDRVGLGSRTEYLPGQFSGGQQQRVAVARAIVNDPRLVVCDEPTSALDHTTGQMVMDLLREAVLAAERALIVVTHDSRVFSYADRIAAMSDGHIERIVRDPRELGH